MSSVVRHFLLGVILGILTIIMLYVMYSTVVTADNGVNIVSEVIVILVYGVATSFIGEILQRLGTKKK